VTSGVLTVACKLITVDEVNEPSIKGLCDFYDLDSTIVARELSEFRVAHRSVHSLVDLTDLQPSSAWTDTIEILRCLIRIRLLTNSLMIVLKKKKKMMMKMMMIEKTVALQSIVTWPRSVKVFHKNEGSVLGSHLFILYTLLLSVLLSLIRLSSSSICWWHSIVHLLSGAWIRLSANILHLQNTIDFVSQWVFANLLSINQSKTEFLLIGLPAQLSKISDPSLPMPSNVTILLVILELFLILLSLCLIISPQFLNLASYLFTIFEG